MRTVKLAALLAALLLMASCTENESTEQDKNAEHELVVARFKKCFYKDGEVRGIRPVESDTETEWAAVVGGGLTPCILFERITGQKAVSGGDTYKGDYRSADGSIRIRLTGTVEAGEDGVKATFLISIPECPEITVFHIVTEAYLDKENDGLLLTDPGVPVIM